MKKSRRFLSVASLSCLLFLFVASTTNLIIKDDQRKVYNIAILSDSTDGNTWSNYLKGVNAASQEYNVELTILNEKNYESVVSYLKRELRYKDNKIDGIIMAQSSATEFDELVKEMNLPVVYVKNEISNQKETVIGVDSLSMGQDMGTLIVKDLADHYQRTMAYIVHRSEYVDQQYYEGLTTVFEKNGLSYHELAYSNLGQVIELQEKLKQLEHPVVLVGCDAKTVEILIDVFGKELQERIWLYGNQSTNKILHHMEENYVKAITVKNDYNSGYLSVEKIVSNLKKKKSGSVLLEYYVIRNNEIYNEEYEAVLFPIS